MWRQQNRLSLSRILVILQIFLVSMTVFFFAKFLWENTALGTTDKTIQAMFLCLCFLLVTFAANYVLDRRW